MRAKELIINLFYEVSLYFQVPKKVYCIGLAISCIPIVIMIVCQITAPPGYVYNWELQADQYYYAANAREIFERGNGFAYANAFDSSDNSPIIYSHLFSLIIGYIWKLTSLPIMLTYLPVRIVFGLLLAISIWHFCSHFFKEKSVVEICFLCLMTSGGFATLLGLIFMKFNGLNLAQFLFNPLYFEGFATWCFINFFRNYFYTTEIIYHFLFVITLVCVLKEKWLLSFIFFILALYAHPYTGIQLGLTYLFYLFLSYLIDSNHRSKYIRLGCAAFILFSLFLFYNVIWLNGFPEHRKIMQSLLVPFIIPFLGLMVGCGVWLWIGVYIVIRYFKNIISSNDWRLIFSLLCITFILMYHYLLTSNFMIQPAHFSRGYPFIALVPLTFYFFQQNLHGSNFLLTLSKNQFLKILIILFLALDNICFLPIAYRTNQPFMRYMAKTYMDVMDYLSSQNNEFVIATSNPYFGYLIPVFTKHRAVISYLWLTPNFNLKKELLNNLINKGEVIFLEEYKNIDLIIVNKEEQALISRYPFYAGWKEIFQNEDYFVYSIHG